MISAPEALQHALTQGAWLAFPFAFLGGLAVGFNPCCLAMYPAITATCCQGACEDGGRPPLARALAFVAGMTVAVTALGLLVALLGRSLPSLPAGFRMGIGFVPLLMGLHFLGWIRIPLPNGIAITMGRSLTGAFIAGLLLSVLVGSCGTPVLVALLSYAAVQGNLLKGGTLMLLYGLGSGIPLLLAGTLVAKAARTWLVQSRRLDQAAGLSLLALGYYLIWTLA